MSFTEFLIMFRDMFCFIPYEPILVISGDTLRRHISKLIEEKTVTWSTSETDICKFEPFLDGTLYLGRIRTGGYNITATIKVYADDSTTPIFNQQIGFGDSWAYIGFQCSGGHKYRITATTSQGTQTGKIVVAGTIGLKDNAKFVLHEITE